MTIIKKPAHTAAATAVAQPSNGNRSKHFIRTHIQYNFACTQRVYMYQIHFCQNIKMHSYTLEMERRAHTRSCDDDSDSTILWPSQQNYCFFLLVDFIIIIHSNALIEAQGKRTGNEERERGRRTHIETHKHTYTKHILIAVASTKIMEMIAV